MQNFTRIAPDNSPLRDQTLRDELYLRSRSRSPPLRPALHLNASPRKNDMDSNLLYRQTASLSNHAYST
jgi:hypothetical protein